MKTQERKRRRARKNMLGRTRYGVEYRRVRKYFARLVAAGVMSCWRCGEALEPGEPWDLGHDDIYPERIAGPEHAHCNRGAPNRLVHSRAW